MFIDQIRVFQINCCDCYLDLYFYSIRNVSNIDEFKHKFAYISNCYYDFYDGCIMVCCHAFLKFVISTNNGSIKEFNCSDYFQYDKKNCYDRFLEHQDDRFCVFCTISLCFLFNR